MVNFINASLASVKMDSQLESNDILTLGKQLRGLSSGNVRTLTVPLSNANGNVAGVGSVVVWSPTLATELWDRMREDKSILDVVTPSPSASETAAPEVIDKFKSRTAAENPCGAIK
jgi:hypothetical protein